GHNDTAGLHLPTHEIFGLSDGLRGAPDQLARDGFIAAPPDLISGLGPNGGGTESVASRDDVVKLVRAVTPEDATAKLDAVRDYAVHLPAANGKSATLGFCWGGGRRLAPPAAPPGLTAAGGFYGAPPARAGP